MLETVRQAAFHFEELSGMQFGWQAEFIQLRSAEQASTISLVQSGDVATCQFQFNASFDQRLHVRPGYFSFGLLESDTAEATVQGRAAPSGALIVFPRDDEVYGASHAGFHGNGIHFREAYLEAIAETVLRMPIRSLIPEAGVYELTMKELSSLLGALYQWRQLAAPGYPKGASMLVHRQEALAMAVLSALSRSIKMDQAPILRSDKALRWVLEYVNSEPSEDMTAVQLCSLADCSQSTLEHAFRKRFGTTPKSYVKCVRLARLREDLLRSSRAEGTTIIELAGVYGFWHMGQLAADYRRIYGELPSDTLKRS